MDRIRDELRAAERAEWPKVVMAATDDGPKSFLFKTRAQGMGILQIVGFTDEPTKGVKIRYKMVQQTNRQGAKNAKVGEEKKVSTAETAESAETAEAQASRLPAFDPVIIEQELNPSPERGLVGFDLDHQRVHEVWTRLSGKPASFDQVETGFGTLQQRRAKGIDLILVSNPDCVELWGIGVISGKWLKSDRDWNDVTASKVAGEFRRLSTARQRPAIAMPLAFLFSNTDFPTTFTFLIGEGGMGILQIVGFTDEPTKGVKIRYKLVQDSSNRQAPGAPGGDAKNTKVGEEQNPTTENTENAEDTEGAAAP